MRNKKAAYPALLLILTSLFFSCSSHRNSARDLRELADKTMPSCPSQRQVHALALEDALEAPFSPQPQRFHFCEDSQSDLIKEYLSHYRQEMLKHCGKEVAREAARSDVGGASEKGIGMARFRYCAEEQRPFILSAYVDEYEKNKTFAAKDEQENMRKLLLSQRSFNFQQKPFDSVCELNGKTAQGALFPLESNLEPEQRGIALFEFYGKSGDFLGAKNQDITFSGEESGERLEFTPIPEKTYYCALTIGKPSAAL